MRLNNQYLLHKLRLCFLLTLLLFDKRALQLIVAPRELLLQMRHDQGV